MRYLLLALLVVTSSAAAQTVPPCSPAEAHGGTGSPFKFRLDAECYAIGWRCPEDQMRHVFAGRIADFLPDWRERAVALASGTETERQDAMRAYITLPAAPAVCAAVTHRVKVALYKQWLDEQSTASAYVVAPAALNASPAGTRPAYPFAGGVRGTTSNGRATQGTPCDCAGARTGDYCGVNGRTDQVALCQPAP
jgi:hypothetical protein